MNLEYRNKGDVIYQVENYKFRYSGKKVAKIELMIFLEEPSYAFTYKLVNEDLPSKIRESSSNDNSLLQKLGLDVYKYTDFKSKEDALQGAIDLISLIDKKKDELVDVTNFV